MKRANKHIQFEVEKQMAPVKALLKAFGGGESEESADNEGYQELDEDGFYELVNVFNG